MINSELPEHIADRLDDRVGRVEAVVQGLREDVAVLKASH